MIAPAIADVVELEVKGIAAGGDGVGRSEGLVVFVPRTAPADVARVRIESVKRFARGALESLVRASPDRIEAPCRHYVIDRCGGCQLQHLRYAAQLEAKRSIVHDAIQRIAKRSADVPETQSSPKEWRYRNKLTLAMRREEATGSWTMGLHPYDDPVAVFQLDDCPITDERIVATWQEIMAAGALLPDAPELRGTVRLSGGEVVVLVMGGVEWPAAADFFTAVPAASALWWAGEHEHANLLFERRRVPAATSFGQVNADVAEMVHASVIARVSAHEPRSVVDAYAGTGETAAALASLGTRVTAIEIDREAANVCAARLPAGSRSLVGRVENLIMGALPADVVILNPPRIGVNERVTTALERHRRDVRAVIYVSCDPATLARDLGRLPSFRVASIQSFDMFPQTAHVETVCELVVA